MKTKRANGAWKPLIVLLAGTTLGTPAVMAQIGACCLGDASCVDTDQSGCDLGGGDFFDEGTVCESAICTGACCSDDADKSCFETSRDDCAATSGIFRGVQTTCDATCPALLGTSFMYQGQLKHNGVPVNDTADVQVLLFPVAEGGTFLALQDNFAVPVVNGLFTLELDFGAEAFAGSERWLEVRVRVPHDPTDAALFETLSPRQPVSAAPYALQTRGIVVGDTGNVGIGTSDPQRRLHIQATPTGGTAHPIAELVVEDINPWIGFSMGASGSSGLVFTAPESGVGALEYSQSLGMLFQVESVRRMRIDPNGNVGIGVAVLAADPFPLAPLHVRGGSPLGLTPEIVGTNNDILIESADARLQLFSDSRGVTGSGIVLGEIVDGAENDRWTLIRRTSGDGSGLRLSHTNGTVMALTPNGNVGIGTLDPEARLDVGGSARFVGVTSQASSGNNDNFILQKSGELGPDNARFRISHRSNGTEVWMYGSDTINGFRNFQSWDYANNRVRFPANGSDLVIDMAGGNVGIGTASPAEKLHVNGNARIDGDIILPATTRTLMIPATSFEHENDFGDLDIGFLGSTGRPILFNAKSLGGDRRAGASVMLPHGAIVTEFAVWVVDNATNQNLFVEMKRQLFGSSQDPSEQMASVTSSGSGGSQVRTDATVSFSTIDNDNYMYWVYVRFPSGTPVSQIMLNSIRITYEITSPLP